jgi:hypothetical protein
MFSSAHDITRFGRAILASELIPEAMSRRWIRPVTFTSDAMAALGSPWGIRRINMGQMYDWIFGYQKAGRIGDYSALMIMIPNLDIGFTLLTAGPMPVNMNFDFADSMGALLLPAVYGTARQETKDLYEGNYISSDPALNSSLTLRVDDKPGISVDRWVSNGTDMRYMAIMLQFSTSTVGEPRIRLFPTGLETVNEDRSMKKSFKATFEDAKSSARVGRLFSTDCASWLSATSEVYATRSLDQFVFHFDSSGKVTMVEPVALRVKLEKTDKAPAMAKAPKPDEKDKNVLEAIINGGNKDGVDMGLQEPSDFERIASTHDFEDLDEEVDDGEEES